MQSCSLWVNFNASLAPGHLHLVKEVRNLLEMDRISATETFQDNREAHTSCQSLAGSLRQTFGRINIISTPVTSFHPSSSSSHFQSLTTFDWHLRLLYKLLIHGAFVDRLARHKAPQRALLQTLTPQEGALANAGPHIVWQICL